MDMPPTQRALNREGVEREVVQILSALVAELHGPAFRPVVRQQDSLDRDLGISSLERVELLLRLERAFGVRLPDDVMAGAESAGSLVEAILTARPVAAEAPPVHAPHTAGAAAPVSASSLVDVLRWHAEAYADRTHIFLRTESGAEEPITYGDLWDRATTVAAALAARGLGRGERVAIMLRTEPAFFPVFFGTLMAGGVPVPMYPPFRADRIEEYVERQIGILQNAEARLLVTFAAVHRVAALLRARVPSLAAVLDAGELEGRAAPFVPAAVNAGDGALIQYTSGSTGEPKGVYLTHANLLANIRAIGQRLRIRPDDVAVSWLPLYHDMGLIGAWLGALYHGAPVAIMSPLAFLARPARWLWAIHGHRGTVSPAPNFAYDLCVRKIAADEIKGLDLGSWRLALNGSEAVAPETLERFIARFEPYGFRPETMFPVYGLAECSVGLAAPPLGQPARLDRISRAAFQQARRIEPAAPDDPSPLRFVTCGRPLPDHDIRIVDRDDRPVGDRVEGRIQFRGPSTTSGYFRNREATEALRTADGWLESGDLGYWAEGELFITGRQKDVIIKGGRNIYPPEIEELVGAIPGVRKGCVAAFAVPDQSIGTERLVIVAETRERAADRRAELHGSIVDRVVSAVGVPPDTVSLAGPGAVLKTSSGKIRRAATRDAYLRGDLEGARRSATVQGLRLTAQLAAASMHRWLAGAGRVAATAWVVLLIAVGGPALWIALTLSRERRAADRLIRTAARALLGLGGCRVRVQGVEHLRADGSMVLAANHASYIDAIVLLAALPIDARFVAKRRLADYPLVGTVIRKAEYVTIEKTEISQRLEGADRVTDALRQGISLVVFPEGTFVRAPGLLPFRLGAFRAAVDARRPVVPIAIRGTRAIFPDGTWLVTPGTVTVTISPAIAPASHDWAEMVRLRDLTRAAIAQHAGEEAVE